MEEQERKKITFKDIKAKQQEDLKSRKIRNFIYRKFSTPFTYLFFRLNVPSPAVSILNFFPLLIGYYLMSIGTGYSMIFGLLFFVLYKIWDCSDGELARIQNPRTMEGQFRNMEGAYFDSVAHLFYPVCIGMGFGIGLYRMYNSSLYFILGVALSILFVLEYGMMEFAKSYFRRGLIDRKIKVVVSDKEYQNEFVKILDAGYSPLKRNILEKLFGIYPFQGLFYLGEFVLPISIALILLEPYANAYLAPFISLKNYNAGLLPLYLILVVFVKSIWTVSFVYRMYKRKYITRYLDDVQNNKFRVYK